MSKSMLSYAVAESIGVFVLVLAGCGAIVVESATGALGHVGVALVFGLVVSVMVQATGHISGAHLNPAVTLAFLSLGRIGAGRAGVYISAQLVAACLASWTVGALMPAAGGAAFGATLPAAGEGQALGMEIVLTATLMFVIVAVATDARAQSALAGPAIGSAVALGALWGGPISGASMNPARSFGPALAAGRWDSHWVYWAGPIVGAVLGAWLYELLRESDTAKPD